MDKMTQKWVIVGGMWGLIGILGTLYLISQGSKSDPQPLSLIDQIVMFTLFLPGTVGLVTGLILTGLLPSEITSGITYVFILLSYIVVPIAVGALTGMGIAKLTKSIKGKANINKSQ